MDIFQIDKNFAHNSFDEPDVEYVNARDISGALFGVYYDEARSLYCRMPDDVASKVSEGVRYNARCTSGGRLRIETDSPFLSLKVAEPKEKVISAMSPTGQFGFAIEEGGLYHGDVSPNLWDEYVTNRAREHFIFQGTIFFKPEIKTRTLTIYFPTYNTVNELYIGVKKGSRLQKAKDYKHKKPILFYGSSIEQGASCSRPGTDYVSTVCKWLDSDFINLGFSGACKAEEEMAKYLATFEPSVFVLAYDYNAPNLEHYKNTHLKLYETIRKKHEHTPILIATRANVSINPYNIREKKIYVVEEFSPLSDNDANARLKIANETYQKARANGDNDVYFLSGETLYGNENTEMNNSDFIHPNDLGFYKMAKAFYPILKQIIERN